MNSGPSGTVKPQGAGHWVDKSSPGSVRSQNRNRSSSAPRSVLQKTRVPPSGKLMVEKNGTLCTRHRSIASCSVILKFTDLRIPATLPTRSTSLRPLPAVLGHRVFKVGISVWADTVMGHRDGYDPIGERRRIARRNGAPFIFPGAGSLRNGGWRFQPVRHAIAHLQPG